MNSSRAILLLMIGGLLVLSANTDGVGLAPIIVGLAYLIPAFVAGLRGKRHPGAVVVVNVFLGWTFIGWIVALAMAFSGDTKKDVLPVQTV